MILRKRLITRWQLCKHEHKILGRIRNFIVGANSPWGETGIIPELSLGCLKDTEFYVESKASFIQISSIALFKPFLIAWLWEYCTFLDGSVVSLKSSPWPKYTQYGTIFQKNHVLLSNFFSSSNMFLIWLFLANTWTKIRGSPCSFKRKGAFISLSSLVWGKSLTFCTCTRSCARANDAKIVRSRDAQCNTKELP